MMRLSTLCLSLLASASFSAARAAIVEGFPDAIVCSVRDPTGVTPWEELVFYVSAHTLNGDTLYKTLTSDPVVIIVSGEGILNAPNLAQCDGRSVDALLEAGRAFYLTPARSGVRRAGGAQD
jgi:hypothetical protein